MAFYQVENIKKNFDSTVVLKGIDFTMEKGEVLAIIGSSGSGKTTLLRCMTFLEAPDCGKITLDGETIIDYREPNAGECPSAPTKPVAGADKASKAEYAYLRKQYRFETAYRKAWSAISACPSAPVKPPEDADKDRKRAYARQLRQYRAEMKNYRAAQNFIERGRKIGAADLRAKKLHFGLVFQSFNLFPHYTALKNVTLAAELLYNGVRKSQGAKVDRKALNQSLKDKAVATLQRMGLGDKLDFYPCQLSGGQQQRVAIARALALEPDILCFDEPTSALDPELTREVLKVIRDLKREGRTMIVVTHEMEFARKVADKVIFMADGVIEEMGTPEEVFGNPASEKTKAFLQQSAKAIDED